MVGATQITFNSSGILVMWIFSLSQRRDNIANVVRHSSCPNVAIIRFVDVVRVGCHNVGLITLKNPRNFRTNQAQIWHVAKYVTINDQYHICVLSAQWFWRYNKVVCTCSSIHSLSVIDGCMISDHMRNLSQIGPVVSEIHRYL